MIKREGYTEVYYSRLAKKAIERNIGFLLRKMANPSELKDASWGKRIKTSNYKGVCYDPASSIRPWKVAYRRKYIGRYHTEELAKKAYELAVKRSGEKIAA